jgi:alcohol dehydrogenase (quinone), cytochrome c subunit
VSRGLWVGGALAVVALAVGSAVVVARKPHSQLTAGAAPTAAADGEYVQRLADCVACHSVPDGAPFAGGLKMGTPLGALYSTNITPDAASGIGAYSLADFDNAVRHGVARDGHRLYPAMPYPSYAKLTDEDLRKLYDFFLHTVRPVSQWNRPTEIAFPLNHRSLMAFWDLAFLQDGTYQDKPQHDAPWNRGAYIVQGPGHCGSCHTARGLAFNETALDDSGEGYVAGALLDGWYASKLRGDPLLGLGRWSEQDIVNLLKVGHNSHATVYGSMLDAFNNSTQYLSDDDLFAIAHYLKSLDEGGTAGAPTPTYTYNDRAQRALDKGDLSAPGAGLFLNQCSSCHGRDGLGHGDLLPPLAGNPAALEQNPSSMINIMLNGAGRIVVHGVPDSYRMTPFRILLSDQDIADIATFVRSSWGNNGPAVSASEVRELRGATDPTSDHVIVLRLR